MVPPLPPGEETQARKLPIESNLLHFNSIGIKCGPAGGPGLWGMQPSGVSSLAKESSRASRRQPDDKGGTSSLRARQAGLQEFGEH